MKTENIKSAKQIVQEAKEWYCKSENAEQRYESAYCLGWLQNEYDRLADTLKAKRRSKKQTT